MKMKIKLMCAALLFGVLALCLVSCLSLGYTPAEATTAPQLVEPNVYEVPQAECLTVAQAPSQAGRGYFSMRGGFYGYVRRSMGALLSEEDGKNKLFSPICLYTALGMLSELTEGESREQILTATGTKSVEDLRYNVKLLLSNLTRQGNVNTVRLENSLWLKRSFGYRDEVPESLAADYSASTFVGVPGSAAYSEMYRDWLDEATGGKLAEYTKREEISADTVLKLVNTALFVGRWQEEFDPSRTTEGTFTTPCGEVTADFMNTELKSYTVGDCFTAVELPFASTTYEMWFILPEHGTTPEEAVASEGVVDLIMHGEHSDNETEPAKVNLSLPKFDVSATADMLKGLYELGITNVTEQGAAEFCFADGEGNEDIFLSELDGTVSVKIDEEGCSAAAYTAMDVALSGTPLNELDMIFDRPFIIAITDSREQIGSEYAHIRPSQRKENCFPLYVGIVNNPLEK